MEFFKNVWSNWLFSSSRVIDRIYSGSFLWFWLENSSRGEQFCVYVFSWTHDQKKKPTVNSKKYYLCYKDYRIIDSKSLHFVSEMFDSYHLGLSGPSRVFDQHNRGFIKYHNSRTNIYMPACFLTKMAAIGKNDGSEIEQNKTVGLYKWWYCLPNSSNAYTIPLNIIYTLSIPSGSIRVRFAIMVTRSCMYKKETWLFCHLI